ncbi:MAG TPA: phosphatase PAP2 family protein [Bordetella sp.]|jgi:membrane-associated phospholipid phosphatase|nr:phosphatase PAP2 family protein [Bordetella sp.]
MVENSAPRGDARGNQAIHGVRADARTGWVAGWILALLLIGGLLLFVDLPLAQALQANVSPTVDHIFKWIGKIGDSNNYAWIVLCVYIASLVALRRGWDGAWVGGYERVTRGALLLMAAWAVGGIVTALLKQTVARARPEMFFEHGFYGLGVPFQGKPFNSFPSSHGLTAFVLASAIAVVAPRWRWPVYALAVLVGISRLVNLDHFASDVAASALIAITVVHALKPWFLDPMYRWPARLPWQWFGKNARR